MISIYINFKDLINLERLVRSYNFVVQSRGLFLNTQLFPSIGGTSILLAVGLPFLGLIIKDDGGGYYHLFLSVFMSVTFGICAFKSFND